MTAAPSTAKDIQLDKDQANTFLIALGKNGDTRMRGFSPWKGSGRKDTLNSGLALQWQQEGLGLYVVINNGGDNDEFLTDNRMGRNLIHKPHMNDRCDAGKQSCIAVGKKIDL